VVVEQRLPLKQSKPQNVSKYQVSLIELRHLLTGIKTAQIWVV